MDELPEPGARDQHEQPVTNDPQMQDTDDAVDYDDAAEYDTVTGVEYAGADYDGPMAAYADRNAIHQQAPGNACHSG